MSGMWDSRKTGQSRRLFLAGSLLMVCLGCASYRAPVGSDVATLTCSVRILKIYGVDQDRTWSWYHKGDGLSEVQLTSGKHTIRARAFMGDALASCHLWFVAKPRGQYELRYHRENMRVAFWIVDKATGRPVGGIKGSDDEPPDTVASYQERETTRVPDERQA